MEQITSIILVLKSKELEEGDDLFALGLFVLGPVPELAPSLIPAKIDINMINIKILFFAIFILVCLNTTSFMRVCACVNEKNSRGLTGGGPVLNYQVAL